MHTASLFLVPFPYFTGLVPPLPLPSSPSLRNQISHPFIIHHQTLINSTPINQSTMPPRSPTPIHGHPQSKPTSNLLSLFLKPFIMLLLTSLFFLFLAFAAFLLLHLFLLGGALHRLRFHPIPNPTPNLNNLPRFRLSRGSEPAPESRCVVCLDGFRNGQWCRKLAGCGHLFHRRCVDTWLVKVAACPTCRTPVRFNADVDLATTQDDRHFWNCATNTNALTILF